MYVLNIWQYWQYKQKLDKVKEISCTKEDNKNKTNWCRRLWSWKFCFIELYRNTRSSGRNGPFFILDPVEDCLALHTIGLAFLNHKFVGYRYARDFYTRKRRTSVSWCTNSAKWWRKDNLEEEKRSVKCNLSIFLGQCFWYWWFTGKWGYRYIVRIHTTDVKFLWWEIVDMDYECISLHQQGILKISFPKKNG